MNLLCFLLQCILLFLNEFWVLNTVNIHISAFSLFQISCVKLWKLNTTYPWKCLRLCFLFADSLESNRNPWDWRSVLPVWSVCLAVMGPCGMWVRDCGAVSVLVWTYGVCGGSDGHCSGRRRESKCRDWTSLKQIEGSGPEWCISNMIYIRDAPFWLETLEMGTFWTLGLSTVLTLSHSHFLLQKLPLVFGFPLWRKDEGQFQSTHWWMNQAKHPVLLLYNTLACWP